MKFLLPLLALSTIAFAEPNSLTEAEKAAGWRLLFDGKDHEWAGSRLAKAHFPTRAG
jgi:hypothetical protein